MFKQAVASLDRRLDAGDAVAEDDVWALLEFQSDHLVRIEISRLLTRVRTGTGYHAFGDLLGIGASGHVEIALERAP
jgi:hypothetical protein